MNTPIFMTGFISSIGKGKCFMEKFSANQVLQLSNNRTDFIETSIQKNVKLVAPNILLGHEAILYVTDFHMESEIDRFGIKSNAEEKYVSNIAEDYTRLDEAIYLGSALDFLHYESVVYTIGKYEFFLRHYPNYSPTNVILNEKMSPNTREWLISNIKIRFPNCQIILMNGKVVLEIKSLFVLTLNDYLVSSNFENMCVFMRKLVSDKDHYLKSNSKILMVRKEQVYFNFKSRKPRNSRIFEWYFKSKGFDLIDPGKMKFLDVLERMFNASFVISYHGGALVNILACKPGTNVVEIYSEWYADCFEQISISGHLNYKSYYYEMKRRPDFLRTLYYKIFNIHKRAYVKHFRIKYRDFNIILQDEHRYTPA